MLLIVVNTNNNKLQLRDHLMNPSMTNTEKYTQGLSCSYAQRLMCASNIRVP